MQEWRRLYPEKFAPEEEIFSHIRRGSKIFIGTGCGEPQYLVHALTRYVAANPRAFVEAEVIQIWSLGVAPYAKEEFGYNFRHNSFFVGEATRDAVNRGLADYTPIFLSQVPSLIYRGRIPIDVALVQVSPPDNNGFVSLGVSVDITRAAVERASMVAAQINSLMPRVHPRHEGIDLRRHHRGSLNSRPRDIDAHAEAHESVVVRRRNLYQRHIDRDPSPIDEGRHLG